MANKSHPGFKKAAQSIAKKQGIPVKNASAILASAGRNASASAHKKNYRLSRIKGK